MSSGENVARSVPTPSSGSAVMSELGLGVAPLPEFAAAGAEPLLGGGEEEEELEKAAFPEAGIPPTTAVELAAPTRLGGPELGMHGARGAGEAEQGEVAVAETLVVVARAAPGWLCPRVDAA
jgi:hypothetical protein